MKQLPLPKHFQPETVGEVRRVRYDTLASEAAAWAKAHELRPAGEDDLRVCLLAVDCQNTFCIPGFELFVAGRSGNGAVEDNARLCRFIYRNLGMITEIVATMDTHRAMQIFHPVFWVDGRGEHPAPHTVITLDDVKTGVWRVNPQVAGSAAGVDLESLSRHALHYAARLTESGKYPLIIWPYHSMLGGIGHALVAAVEEALFFHTVARGRQARLEIKGENPLTEHYSVLRPEVSNSEDGKPIGGRNECLIEHLLSFDRLVIAGQAKSHCVAWTVEDLIEETRSRSRDTGSIYLLEDCTSPVVVSGKADFTAQADSAFRRFAESGAHIVQASTAVEEWAGFTG